jgi:hypothetical protein
MECAISLTHRLRHLTHPSPKKIKAKKLSLDSSIKLLGKSHLLLVQCYYRRKPEYTYSRIQLAVFGIYSQTGSTLFSCDRDEIIIRKLHIAELNIGQRGGGHITYQSWQGICYSLRQLLNCATDIHRSCVELP